MRLRGSSWTEFLQHIKAICAWMQAFILLIKQEKSKQNSKTSFTWKRGEERKNKAQPTTKTQTKPPVLIKSRVDSNPESGKKAPDLMREGAEEEQNSPQFSLALLPSDPSIPWGFLHPAFGGKELSAVLQGALYFAPHCSTNWGGCKTRVGLQGAACGSQRMGWFHGSSCWDGEGSGQRDLLQKTKLCRTPSKTAFSYFTF